MVCDPSQLPITAFRSWSSRLVIFLFTVCLLLLSPLFGQGAVYSQSTGAEIRVASGYPTELPADGQSETVLEVDYANCSFGAPTDPDGNYSVTLDSTLGELTPRMASTVDGGTFPPPFTLQAGLTPGEAALNVTVSYCPADAIVLLGVCSDPAYMDASCSGTAIFLFTEVPQEEQNQNPADEPADPPEEEPVDTLPQAEENSDQLIEKEEPSLAKLYQDLETFLAGEGIEAPTPGMMAASGIALTALLGTWLIMNRLSGVSAEQSLEAIQAWRQGKVPSEKDPLDYGASAEIEDPPRDPDPDFSVDGKVEPGMEPPEPAQKSAEDPLLPGISDSQGPPAPHPPDPAQSTPMDADLQADSRPQTGTRPPVQESAEDRVVRGAKDLQALDDALKQTRKDLNSFLENVPDGLKNSQIWKKHAALGIKKVEDWIKMGELDKARDWLDRVEKLVKVRQKVARELDHLTPAQQEMLVWTERTLKGLGHIGADAYRSAVIDPARAAADKILPSELSKNINQKLDEFDQGIRETAEGVSELARTGARGVTDSRGQDQLQHIMENDPAPGNRQMAEEIADIRSFRTRKVPVEQTDFIGRGTAKVRELYDGFMTLFTGKKG